VLVMRHPIHHMGFLVPDIGAAVEHWRTVYGVGPFFRLEHVVFDRCTAGGQDVHFDHSAAFAQWGPIAVELQQFHEVPPQLAPLLSAGREQGINHVAYAVPDAGGERERLAALGFPAYLHAQLGEIDVTFHDCIDLVGYSIEVHQAGPALDGYFAVVADGARDWDGTDPLRSFPGA
jgi:catechol 2,3-dioxygenase-like lactoylglutathione lyase family enzyme